MDSNVITLSEDLLVGIIFIAGMMLVIGALLIWRFDSKYWIGEMRKLRDRIQSQLVTYCDDYNKIVEERDVLKQQFNNQKDTIRWYQNVQEYLKVDPTLRSQLENQRDTIKYYQNIMSWYMNFDKEKIGEFVQKQIEKDNV
jgi:(2Fe-2S) ferredoxin